MRLGDGVKWRAYDDGVVAYVPATCETHVLPPQFAAFFRAVDSGSLEPINTCNLLADVPSQYSASIPQEPFLSELVALKILDAGN